MKETSFSYPLVERENIGIVWILVHKKKGAIALCTTMFLKILKLRVFLEMMIFVIFSKLTLGF